MANREELGDVLLQNLLGAADFEKASAAAVAGGFGSFAIEHARGSCFGDIWSRPGLGVKARSMVTIAMLTALRATDQLRIHIGVALNLGLTATEIEELLYQAIPYLGYPATMSALKVAKEVLAEKGLLTPPDPDRHG